jgi:GNAT superfamily N-acetyltransferase
MLYFFSGIQSSISICTSMAYHIQVVSGASLSGWLPEVARLRIEVFREFPYLYDGDLSYELKYLRHYTESTESVFVLALSDDKVVGVSTAMPLLQADEAFGAPFRVHSMDPGRVFYFGESVLLSSWRGKGIGHAFFDKREQFAASLGYTITAFCAVDREPAHMARPVNYRPLDPFWKRRGYSRRPGLQVQYAWREIGAASEQMNTLTFWTRDWEAQ